MTPEILLICTTLITNSASDTTASRQCTERQAEMAPVKNSFEALSLRALNDVADELASTPDAGSSKARAPVKRLRHGHGKLAYGLGHKHHRLNVVPTGDVAVVPDKRPSFWDMLLKDNEVRFFPNGN